MKNKLFTLVLILATLFISSTVSALGIYYPADGIYSIQPKFALDKELSVQNHASNWGANVIIDNLNSGWQKWKIQRIPGTHFYSIVAVSSNLAIDVANAQASDGANIATWPFLEGRQNQFAFFDAGGSCYVIKANLDGNFVLDVERAENRAGANVLSWSFNGGDNQLWRLVMIRRLPEFQSYNKRATRKVTAYVMPDLQSRSGNEYVSAGDDVTVLREEGNAYLVRYPVSGGTKTRWVNKNEIFSGSTPNNGNVNIQGNNPTPSGVLYPLKGSSIKQTDKSSSTNGFKCDYVTGGSKPVYAPFKGKVEFRQSYATRYNKLASYGNNVRLYSEDGQFQIRLAHFISFVGCRNPLKFTESLPYPCGQSNSNKGPFDTIIIDTIDVNPGDLIGYSGMTGNASAHHIHIEVYKKQNGQWKPVNPNSVFTTW